MLSDEQREALASEHAHGASNMCEPSLYVFSREEALAFSRAVEAKAREQLLPEGYRIVPVEPTEHQSREALIALIKTQQITGSDGAKIDSIYRAMIASAPPPPEQMAECKPQWIPVSERMPEVGATVLVTNTAWVCPRVLTFRVFPGERFVDEWAGKWYWAPKSMHWMPLPEPPGITQQGDDDGR